MNLKFFSPHLVSLLVFIIAALLYFHPVLKGEKLSQSDITQHIGMAKEVNDYRTTTGSEPYWAESAFSGMPTYQIGTYFPHDYLSYLDRLIRFLPRPADYLFLYFLGFYILLLAFKVDWKLAIMGSLAFGFSTYLMIIFGAGHNAKAHAIAYMPLVLAGVIYVFKKQYLLGFTLTGLATALEIKANHPQMTYYLLFAIFILGIIELIEAIKKKQHVDPHAGHTAKRKARDVLAGHPLPVKGKQQRKQDQSTCHTQDNKTARANQVRHEALGYEVVPPVNQRHHQQGQMGK